MSESIEKIVKIKNIKMNLPNNLDIMKTNIDIIMNKDEEIIKKYIERIIYTSKIPHDVSSQLDKVFTDVRQNIL
jgi:pilus assembly protein TadC